MAARTQRLPRDHMHSKGPAERQVESPRQRSSARMGLDPATSVTDAFNRSHDVPNLFIADASSMPTSGGVNPSSTIQALALRCADHIWDRRRDW